MKNEIRWKVPLVLPGCCKIMSHLNLNLFTYSTKPRQRINKIIHKSQLHYKFGFNCGLVNKHPKAGEPAEGISLEGEPRVEKWVGQRIDYKAEKEDLNSGGNY